MTPAQRAFDLPRPHDIETEQQLLGELLLNNAAAVRFNTRGTPRDRYNATVSPANSTMKIDNSGSR